jgi:hypothetical protein
MSLMFRGVERDGWKAPANFKQPRLLSLTRHTVTLTETRQTMLCEVQEQVDQGRELKTNFR